MEGGGETVGSRQVQGKDWWGGTLDGASHLARGQGAVILSCVLSSMEHAFSTCLWVSEGRWEAGGLMMVVKRKHGEEREAQDKKWGM